MAGKQKKVKKITKINPVKPQVMMQLQPKNVSAPTAVSVRIPGNNRIHLLHRQPITKN